MKNQIASIGINQSEETYLLAPKSLYKGEPLFFYNALHIPSLAMYLYSRLVAFCGANTLLVAPGVDWVSSKAEPILLSRSHFHLQDELRGVLTIFIRD